MPVFKSNKDITKTSPGPRKAPVPQVDKEHFRDMRQLEKDPHHIDRKFRDSADGPVRGEER